MTQKQQAKFHSICSESEESKQSHKHHLKGKLNSLLKSFFKQASNQKFCKLQNVFIIIIIIAHIIRQPILQFSIQYPAYIIKQIPYTSNMHVTNDMQLAIFRIFKFRRLKIQIYKHQYTHSSLFIQTLYRSHPRITTAPPTLMMSTFKEKAIPMVSVDPQTGKYEFEPQAINFLKSITGPIAVVSVAGLYRTGKSYLLNRMLLNRSNGFGVGPTVNPCTKGLWVWATPLKGKTSEGEDISIIVIDTEGIGALDEDQTHDTKIFTLAILASSCFIYNSVGTIDESAIQNLSLVVNLTKHIHIKTQSKGTSSEDDDIDPQEFANFFPAFYWVVRDFSLSLVDANNNPISSKQYLENALTEQKGQSDDTEEKNRVRRLLTAFFPERECFTLVRPIIDEKKLNLLDKMGLEELRPEFTEQVMNFRKRVFSRIRPKMLNNKKLNGDMYLSLLKNYVVAINEGAVPNIENAWNYMCNEQCGKITDEAFDFFESKVAGMKFPCTEEEFRSIIKTSKDEAYELFKKKAFGDSQDQFHAELKKRIKTKITSLKSQNERESSNYLYQYISKTFEPLQKKIKLHEYKSYSEFEQQMTAFIGFVNQNGPRLANRQILLLQFIKKVLPQVANFFLRKYDHELNTLKNLTKEREVNSEKEIKSLQSELVNDRKNMSEKISMLDKEKVELTLKVERLTEDLERFTKEKENESTRLGKNLEARQTELESVKRSLQQKINDLSEKNEQLNRELLSGRNEWEKEKAILDLKIKQMTSPRAELQRKEKMYDMTINSSKSEFNFQLKQTTLKFEKRVSDLTLQLNESREKVGEMSEELKNLKEELESTKEKFEKKEKKYKEDLSNRIKELEKMKHETQLEKNRLENEYELSKEQVGKDYRELSENCKKYEATIKQLNEQIKNQKSTSDKELAISNQNLDFANQTISKLKQQLQEDKKDYEARIEAMEEASGRMKEESENQRFVEIKNEHFKEIKKIQEELENTKEQLQFEKSTLLNSKQDLELKISLLQETAKKSKEEYEEQIKKAEERIQSITNEMSAIERNKNGKLKEQEVNFENRIRELEREIEEINEKSSMEQRDSHTRSEEAITTLKNYYEIEKEKLENKLINEKEKADRKYKKMVEEYEDKLDKEITALQEENDNLANEMADMEENFRRELDDVKYQLEVKTKAFDNLEKSHENLKVLFASREKELTEKYEQLMKSSRLEKEAQYEKIENLQKDVNMKERSIMTLTHSEKQLTASLEKTENTLSEIKREFTDFKASSEKQTEELKKKLQDAASDHLEKKINYEKAIALSTQESEFYSKKVKDLQKQIEMYTQTYDERMKALKEETTLELKSQSEKYQAERTQIESKYEKLKKTSRETEAGLQKQITDLEKEKAIDQEKLMNLDQRYKDMEEKKRSETETYIQQIQTLKENFSTESRNAQVEIEKVKMQLATLESQKTDLFASYERDKALWENGKKFAEDQINMLKQESSDKIKKLEFTISNLQEGRVNDKRAADSSHNDYVSKTEKKYLQQIHELNESMTRKTAEFEAQIKELELKYKTLNEKYTLEVHSKNANQVILERRINEFIENEKRYSESIETMRKEKEDRIRQFQVQLDKEKDNQKAKFRELEEKYRSVQNEKRNIYFEFEKSKVKWQTEDSNRNEKFEALMEQIGRQQTDLERLQRENEKLKTQKRNSKNTSYISRYGGSERPMSTLNKSNIGGGVSGGGMEFNLLEDKENIEQK